MQVYHALLTSSEEAGGGRQIQCLDTNFPVTLPFCMENHPNSSADEPKIFVYQQTFRCSKCPRSWLINWWRIKQWHLAGPWPLSEWALWHHLWLSWSQLQEDQVVMLRLPVVFEGSAPPWQTSHQRGEAGQSAGQIQFTLLPLNFPKTMEDSDKF